MQTIKEILEQIEEIYHSLNEDCFCYVGTIIYDEASIELNDLQKLNRLVDELTLSAVFDSSLLKSIKELIDVQSRVYLFSMYNDENLDEHQNIHDIRRKQVEEASDDLRKLGRLLEKLIYTHNVDQVKSVI